MKITDLGKDDQLLSKHLGIWLMEPRHSYKTKSNTTEITFLLQGVLMVQYKVQTIIIAQGLGELPVNMYLLWHEEQHEV